MKKGLTAYSGGQVGALRVLISAVIFLPYLLFNLKRIDRKKIKYIIGFGFLEIGAPPFLFAYAQTVVDSSTAGILNGLTPIFTLIVGAMFFGITFNLSKVTGVLLGFLGGVLLIFGKASGSGMSFDFTNAFGLLIVIATIMYGFAGNFLKQYLSDVPGTLTMALAFVTMGIPSGIYLFTTDFVNITLARPENLHAFLAVAVLSTFGSAIAMTLFNVLIKKATALFASFVTYLIPFVAMTWGFLDGEAITFYQVLSLAVILGGITLANLSDGWRVKRSELGVESTEL
jgi:drug/metabolite transporter (DMT)-like permease